IQTGCLMRRRFVSSASHSNPHGKPSKRAAQTLRRLVWSRQHASCLHCASSRSPRRRTCAIMFICSMTPCSTWPNPAAEAPGADRSARLAKGSNNGVSAATESKCFELLVISPGQPCAAHGKVQTDRRRPPNTYPRERGVTHICIKGLLVSLPGQSEHLTLYRT